MKYLLLSLAFGAVVALAYAETTCQTHKRNSGTSGHGLKWNIQCDDEGYYLPLQCTEDQPKKQWCACYNKEEAITSPSRKTRQCDCPLKVDEIRNGDDATACVPACANTGKWVTKQCCRQKCYCVDPNTGEKTTEPTNDLSLQCS